MTDKPTIIIYILELLGLVSCKTADICHLSICVDFIFVKKKKRARLLLFAEAGVIVA